MTLFEECIQALGNNIKIYSDQETKEMFNKLVSVFPVTSWGRINWNEVSFSVPIDNLSMVEDLLESRMDKSLSKDVFLLWNYSDAPLVKAELSKIIQVIDDVTAVGSDTWIFSPYHKFVIEFFHEGQITLGIN